MPPSRQVKLTEMFGGESDRVRVTWSMEPPKDPEEQARAHDREILGMKLRAAVTIASMALVAVLSALFLAYGKADQAEKVVTAALGVLSGFAIGEIGRKAASKE
jgi:hypothetical protein